jgi:porphobilinogen synthase
MIINGMVNRPRRLRRTPALRRLVAQTRLSAADLVLPLFYREGISEPREISAMPGVMQHTVDSLKAAVDQALAVGVGGVMLFAVPQERDDVGSGATDYDGALNTAVRTITSHVGDSTVVMADLCLDEFTSHGHCGIVTVDGVVDNDLTLGRYREMALELADAGAQVLGTSGMMDGQVGAVRTALDEANFQRVLILAYAAKYSSAFYGPFREAVDSQLVGSRSTYQQDPANRREAARELGLDLAEGADIVMVKPAMPYLDILADVAAAAEVPVAAYQVSGEYSMIEAAAEKGWIDRDAAITESLISIKRAGADIIFSYFAAEVAAKLP